MKSRLLPILITGFVLALGFLLAVQVAQTVNKADVIAAPLTVPSSDDFNQTVAPAIFDTISEDNERLRITGTSEPGAIISVRNDGQGFRQLNANGDGKWDTVIKIEGNPVMIIDLLATMEDGVSIRSDETVFRIPAPKTIQEIEGETLRPALLMVTAPGGPTRVVQSPFSGWPQAGPISMGPIEYDDAGSAIFSGSSDSSGTVRIFAGTKLIGQRPVIANGRWFFIAAESLPDGPYNLSVELEDEFGEKHRLDVPFERLTHAQDVQDAGRSLRLNYEPEIWQISRTVHGGGRQYTAIFAPIEDSETPEPAPEP